MAVAIKGLQSAKSKRGKRGLRTYVRTYKIYTDTPPGTGLVDQEIEIYAVLAGLTPPIRIGQPHPVDNIAICEALDLDCLKRHTSQPETWEWLATASYSSENLQLPSDTPDPTQQVPKVSITNETRKIAFILDVNNEPVVNSSQEPIPNDQDQYLTVIDIEAVFSDFSYEYCLDASFDTRGMVNSLNASELTIPVNLLKTSNFNIPEGCGLMRQLRISPLHANGTTYAVANIQILHDPNGHVKMFIDQGFKEIRTDPTTGELSLVPIMNGGTTPNVPCLLDGSGHQLYTNAGDTSAPPVILSFQPHVERSWSWLQSVLDGFH